MRKSWLAVLSRRLKKVLARLYIGRGERWYVWEGAQVGFESLDLMTEGIKKEKLLWLVGETEMKDLGVVEILGLENFE